MSTLTKEQREYVDAVKSATHNKPVIIDPKKITTGAWVLTYTLVNSLGVEGFSGRNITTYADALTQSDRILFDMNGKPLPGLFIDKTSVTFDAGNNKFHQRIVDWLIGHPEVGVEGIDVRNEYKTRKNTNPRFKLVNLNWQATEQLEEDDFIDRVIGQLVTQDPKKKLSLKEVRYVLAALNKPYRDAKYITNKTVERRVLMGKIKDYVRSGKQSAGKVKDILSNLENARMEFELREMKKYGMITFDYGVWKFNDIPLGSTWESVITHFNTAPDVYATLQKELFEKLKADGLMK